MKKILLAAVIMFCVSVFGYDMKYSKNVEQTVKEKGEVSVSYTVPADNVLTDKHPSEITIKFDKPIFPLMKIDTIKLKYNIEPEVKGVFVNKGSDMLIFRPDSPLKYDSEYVLTIFKGMLAEDGSVLKEDFKLKIKPVNLQILYLNDYYQKVHPDSALPMVLNYKIPLSRISGALTITEAKSGKEMKYSLSESDSIRKKYRYSEFQNQMGLKIKIEDMKARSEYRLLLNVKDLMRNKIEKVVTTIDTLEYINHDASIVPSYMYDTYYYVYFTNPIKSSEAKKYLKMYDEAGNVYDIKSVYWNESSSYYYFTLIMEPGKTYYVEIPKELKDIYGFSIVNPGKYSLKAEDYYPMLSCYDTYKYTLKDPKFELTSINYENIMFMYRKLSVTEYIRKNYGDYYDYYNEQERKDWLKGMMKKNLIVKYKKNVMCTTYADVGKVFDKDPFLATGIFAAGRDTITYHLQNSSCKIHLIAAEKNGYILLTDRENSKRIKERSDAYVYDSKGNPFRHVYLNDGLLKTGLELFGKSGANTFLYVKNKLAKGIMPLNLYRKEGSYDFLYTYTDRNLYQLNDSVLITGLIRKIEGNSVDYSSIRKIDYTVRNPEYNIVEKGTLNVDSKGMFSQKLMIGDTCKTGSYYFEYKAGSQYLGYQYFLVQEFKEPTFKTELSVDKSKYMPGEESVIKLSGEYLTGVTMTNDSASIDFNASKSSFYADSFPGFTFYISNDSVFDTLLPVYGVTGKDGVFTYKNSYSKLKSKNPLYIYPVGTITSVSKEKISSSASFQRITRKYYGGLMVSESSKNGKDTLICEVLFINGKGEKEKNRKFSITAVRSDYYRGETDTILNKEMTCKNGLDTLKIEVKKDGYYSFTLNYDGCTVKADRYAGYNYDKPEERKFAILLDKTLYRPGDTLHAKITSPDIKGRYYIFTSSDVMLSLEEKEISADTERLDIIITEDLMPSFNIGLFSVSEDSIYMNYMITENVRISYESKRMILDLKTDKESYQCGDSVIMDISSDKDGYAVISCSDEAVLMLTGYSIPDPLHSMYSRIGHSVYYENSYPMNRYQPYYLDGMMERTETTAMPSSQMKYASKKSEDIRDKDGGSMTGDIAYAENEAEPAMDATKFDIRQKFSSSPFYLSGVEIRKGANTRVTFKLPDNASKFRVTVVAYSRDCFGKAEKSFASTKDLVIKDALPLFLRPFDKLYAGYTLIDRTEESGEADVMMTVRNVKLEEPKQKKTAIRDSKGYGEFLCTAEFEDTASFTIFAQKGEKRDAISVKIPIVNATLYEHNALFKSTEDKAQESVLIDDGVVKDKSSVDVTLNSTIIGGLELPLRFLEDYRYLCLEQRMSMILPFITGEEIINAYNISEIKGAKLKKYVKSILKDVKKFQDGNGGFKYYEDSPYVSEYLTAYVMYVLFKAKESGYSVDEDMLSDGLAYMKNHLIKSDESVWGYAEYGINSYRAFMLYVLSLYGVMPENEVIKSVYEARDRMYMSEKARLMAALKSWGMESAYNTVLKELMGNVTIEATYALFDDKLYDCWFFQNEIKNTSVVLSMILATEGKFEFAEQAASYIVSRMKNGLWINTHTTALALEALTQYFRIYEKDYPQFEGIVKLNGSEEASKKFSGRKDQAYPCHLDSKKLKEGKNILEVMKKGTGRLYYTVRLKYAVKKAKDPLFNGFDVERTYTSLDGKVVNSFKKGEFYVVNIKIKTQTPRSFVMLEDNLPAGFEVVKKEFVTEFANLKWLNRKIYWWGGFSHEEFYADRVTASAVYLYKGEHTYTYIVKARSSGEFLAPACNVFEMYTPEVFGHTADIRLTVD